MHKIEDFRIQRRRTTGPRGLPMTVDLNPVQAPLESRCGKRSDRASPRTWKCLQPSCRVASGQRPQWGRYTRWRVAQVETRGRPRLITECVLADSLLYSACCPPSDGKIISFRVPPRNSNKWWWWVWTIAAAYRRTRTHDPRRLAWSKGRRPLGTACIQQMNRVNSVAISVPWWQHHKYCHYYYVRQRKAVMFLGLSVG